MSNSERVQKWRQRAKLRLVDICGNMCCLCGYNRCAAALEFHHLDPTQKDFAVTGTRITRKFQSMVKEARKCVMLCSNCHREVHQGLVESEHLVERQIWNEDKAIAYMMETDRERVSGRFSKGGKSNPVKKVTDSQLLGALNESPNVRQALLAVGLTPYNANYQRVKRLLKK